jgi:phosphoglycerate dehydrogenase-like enzyme
MRRGSFDRIITGYAENAVIGSGQLGSGMQVVSKPFDMDVLATKIRELIQAMSVWLD